MELPFLDNVCVCDFKFKFKSNFFADKNNKRQQEDNTKNG